MSELKVQFGCGGNILEGWRNHDAEVDITKPLPYENDSVDLILAEHIFEHVSGPDALRFLDECRRILKPGGILRLCVPVIIERLTIPAARDIVINHGHLCGYNPQLLNDFLLIAGFSQPNIKLTSRHMDYDGHWKVIGKEKDDAETCRIEAKK